MENHIFRLIASKKQILIVAYTCIGIPHSDTPFYGIAMPFIKLQKTDIQLGVGLETQRPEGISELKIGVLIRYSHTNLG